MDRCGDAFVRPIPAKGRLVSVGGGLGWGWVGLGLVWSGLGWVGFWRLCGARDSTLGEPRMAYRKKGLLPLCVAFAFAFAFAFEASRFGRLVVEKAVRCERAGEGRGGGGAPCVCVFLFAR